MAIFIYSRKLISAKDHPNAHKGGQLYEFRLEASKILGKALPAKCIVHHYDDFYILCEDQTYHLLLHIRQRAFEATGDPHKRKCYLCKQYDTLMNLRMYICSGRTRYYYNSCNTEKARHRREQQIHEIY